MRVSGCDAMLLKAVTFFLIGMAVLGMFGKLRTPKLPKIGLAKRCPECGAKTPSGGKCPCRSGAS